MESRGMQNVSKQVVYFSDKAAMEACNDNVIKVLVPNSKYCAHNLNFVNCFLNNTPPKAQQFILHWGGSHNQYKGFRQDVFEIITVQLTEGNDDREVHYLIPVPVLFEMLGLEIRKLVPDYWFEECDPRDLWESNKNLAFERVHKYNEILGAYCEKHDIAFHELQAMIRKKSSYMKSMRL